jgi:hypothetical protein
MVADGVFTTEAQRAQRLFSDLPKGFDVSLRGCHAKYGTKPFWHPEEDSVVSVPLW